MYDSTKITIAVIIAFTIIVVALIFSSQANNPTNMNEQTRQQICNEEGLECK